MDSDDNDVPDIPLTQADADRIRTFLREDADRIMGRDTTRRFTPKQRRAVPEILSLLQQSKELDQKIDVLLYTAVAVVSVAFVIYGIVHFSYLFPPVLKHLGKIVTAITTILVVGVSSVWYKHDIFATHTKVKQLNAIEARKAAATDDRTDYNPVAIAKTNTCKGRALVTETYPQAKKRTDNRA